MSPIDERTVQATKRPPSHRLTAAVLQSACEPLIALNTCEGIRLPRRRRQDTVDRVISRDQVRKKLLPAAPERYRQAKRESRQCGRRATVAHAIPLRVLRPALGARHPHRDRRQHHARWLKVITGATSAKEIRN
jgi:hypothetical protein